MIEQKEKAYKGIVPKGNVNRIRVYHTSEWEQKLWMEFWTRALGFRFFSKEDNQHEDRYIVFAKYHKDEQLLLAIAEGRNHDIYNRIPADGWFNNRSNESYQLDLATMRPVISQQRTFDF